MDIPVPFWFLMLLKLEFRLSSFVPGYTPKTVVNSSNPRLPNTLFLEIFEPQKPTQKTKPQQVFGSLGKHKNHDAFPGDFLKFLGQGIRPILDRILKGGVHQLPPLP